VLLGLEEDEAEEDVVGGLRQALKEEEVEERSCRGCGSRSRVEADDGESYSVRTLSGQDQMKVYVWWRGFIAVRYTQGTVDRVCRSRRFALLHFLIVAILSPWWSLCELSHWPLCRALPLAHACQARSKEELHRCRTAASQARLASSSRTRTKTATAACDDRFVDNRIGSSLIS
jgi:hypothetical protein